MSASGDSRSSLSHTHCTDGFANLLLARPSAPRSTMSSRVGYRVLVVVTILATVVASSLPMLSILATVHVASAATAASSTTPPSPTSVFSSSSSSSSSSCDDAQSRPAVPSSSGAADDSPSAEGEVVPFGNDAFAVKRSLLARAGLGTFARHAVDAGTRVEYLCHMFSRDVLHEQTAPRELDRTRSW